MSDTDNVLIETIRRLVREEVGTIARDEVIETLRALNIQSATDDTDLDNLVDAIEIAPFLGCDVSTEQARHKARQKVYHLARTGKIPSVRISDRTLRFSPSAVRRSLLSRAA